jgi:uncharacterized membrane protein YcfT
LSTAAARETFVRSEVRDFARARTFNRMIDQGLRTASAFGPPAPAPRDRVAWVDCARGWCIVLVVMMHAALGVGVAVGDTGWLHAVVAFAKPFRMPDFFLVAGLFAARAIEAPLRRFLDRKVIHFVYFYLLWLFIALAVKAHELGILAPRAFAETYVWRLVEPFSTTWFIQLLPIFYIVTRACRRVPTVALFAVAFLLHMAAATVPKGGAYSMESQLTGSISVDGFLLFWIYFLIGVRFRDLCFRLADAAVRHKAVAGGLLVAWGVLEAVATQNLWPERYGFDLPFGLLGALAVVTVSALVARWGAMAWLGAIGRQSLVVYLSFFLPMAAARVAILKLAPTADVGLVSLAVTAIAVAVPLGLARLVRGTRLGFLFERPHWARLREAAPPDARPADRAPVASLPPRAEAA